MKVFILQLFAGLGFFCLFACAHKQEQTSATSSAETARVWRETETFTGEVVREVGGYRFKPSEEPDNLRRLTRAKKIKDFAAEEIHLRKYFGKTLVVRGESEGEWIAHAQVVGQWLRPGEVRGPTLTGPEPR